MSNGDERLIAYASCALTSLESNYAQIEQEALAIIFGVWRFHQYLYGRKFTLVTDHCPLCNILGEKEGIPPLAAARMQRWALLLSAYRNQFSTFLVNLIIVRIVCHVYLAQMAIEMRLKMSMQW